MMPKSENKFPLKQEVVDYLCSYEKRYKLKITRPAKVNNVKNTDSGFIVESDTGIYHTRTVVSATGTWQHPIIPEVEGIKDFSGLQIHSAQYKNPDPFIGKKTLVVGGGNSGAQLLAELSLVTEAKWATLHEPAFLPDDVDGRVLFNTATAKYNALQQGKEVNAKEYSLGNIVMVPSVKNARERGVLKSSGNFTQVTAAGVVWENGKEELFNAIIWCTGFGFATHYLSSLIELDEKGKAATLDTRSQELPGLWLVGYGSWTGFASATLIGVGRSARQTIKEVEDYLVNKIKIID
jgi:cation diffusion facilitator CzcD-associated flavoprotein CzcO